MLPCSSSPRLRDSRLKVWAQVLPADCTYAQSGCSVFSYASFSDAQKLSKSVIWACSACTCFSFAQCMRITESHRIDICPAPTWDS